ncbi:MAG: glucosaminidase domain-containing protein [Clostridia bacterium]
MKSKEKNIKVKITLKTIIFSAFAFFIILYMVMFYNIYFPINKSYAKETDVNPEEIRISNANEIDIDEIINENSDSGKTIQITQKEEELEYLTEYRTNKDIPKGISYVIQEGRQGTQNITIKSTYKDGELLSEEQIGADVVKASCNKIIEIGGASYTSNYKAKIGDVVYVTSDELGLMESETEDSRRITTLKRNDNLKILKISQNWYEISYQNMTGWVKSECTTYIDSTKENTQTTIKSKQELNSNLNINIALNKPSGLSLEQFKKVLNDSKDKNKIFSNNAEYFYYIEKQYNINGIFVAAVGIHESAWGTSKIALQKNNLFGYGAYDSNPYNGAYNFSNYSESIDLISRVFVKYYINPKGTSIYGGETAIGTYYNGATLNGINKKYASDKNWANSVYSHMQYLYNKL